jgi:hypothetical protein
MRGSHSRVLAGTLAYLLASVFWGLNIAAVQRAAEALRPVLGVAGCAT